MNDNSHTEGATAGDDVSGLLLNGFAERRARDAAELEAITAAYNKHLYRARRKKTGSGWLTDAYLRQTHRDMFGTIWAWAGKYRTTDKKYRHQTAPDSRTDRAVVQRFQILGFV